MPTVWRSSRSTVLEARSLPGVRQQTATARESDKRSHTPALAGIRLLLRTTQNRNAATPTQLQSSPALRTELQFAQGHTRWSHLDPHPQLEAQTSSQSLTADAREGTRTTECCPLGTIQSSRWTTPPQARAAVAKPTTKLSSPHRHQRTPSNRLDASRGLACR